MTSALLGLALVLAPLPSGASAPWAQSLSIAIVAAFAAFASLGLARGELAAPRGRSLWIATGFFAVALIWGWAQSALPARFGPHPLVPEAARDALAFLGVEARHRIALDPAAAQLAVARGAATLVIFWIAAVLAAREENANRLFDLVIAGGVAWTLHVVLIDVIGLDLAPWRAEPPLDRPSGPFVDPDAWAIWAGAALLLALHRLSEIFEGLRATAKPGERPLASARVLLRRSPSLCAAAAILALGAAIAQSPGGALASCCGVSVLCVAAARRLRGEARAIAFAPLAVIATLAAAPLLAAALGRLGAPEVEEAGRVDAWNALFASMQGHWAMGIGLGGYETIGAIDAPAGATAWLTRAARNDHLELIASLGLLGAAPVYFGLVAIVARFAERLRVRAPQIAAPSALGLALGAALAIHAAFGAGLQAPASGYLLAALIGACLGRAEVAPPRAPKRRRARVRRIESAPPIAAPAVRA